MSFIGIFISYRFLNLSSSNAVLYVLKDAKGLITFSSDLNYNETEKLLFMVDASPLFSLVEGIASSSSGGPLMRLSWDRQTGKGVIKETRPDGSKFLVVLSRYKEDTGYPRGVFIGGDLPFGDVDRLKDRSRNNTGISFFDGDKWQHIWCSANEAVSIKGIDTVIEPEEWKYLGSRVLKDTNREVLIQSMHEFSAFSVEGVPVRMLMTRTLSKKGGDDYLLLKVQYKNGASYPIEYFYSYGDEPWVGEFGDSAGDVGWTDGRVFQRESYLLPRQHSFAGYWDTGNLLAGEPRRFSGYADFVEWLSIPPALVYFSNSFSLSHIKENRPLDSRDNRIINLVWFSETLQPGESKTYELAFGMARPDPRTGQPVKPPVNAF